MRKVTLTVACAILAISLAACGGSSGGGGGDTGSALKGLATCTAQTGEAVICGTVYAADGTTPVIGATITQGTASGDEVALTGLYKGVASDTACQTDTSGAFACSGITTAGTFTFYIASDIGSSSFSQAATIGETADVPASSTTISGSSGTAQWLVVPGAYDGIQKLLADMKGCTLTGDESNPPALTNSDECEALGLLVLTAVEIDTYFSDVAELTAYDSIFVNCATDLSSYSTVLEEYVAQGGNMYFSDLADDGLTTAFPGNVTFGTAATSSGTVAAADIDDTGLATYLGVSTMEIVFDLGSWQDITSVESNVTTYISGDTSSLGGMADAPITVGWKEDTGGCLFYTSYHVEASTAEDANQEKALKYLVLNISQICQ